MHGVCRAPRVTTDSEQEESNASIPNIQLACGTVAKETELAMEQILSGGK